MKRIGLIGLIFSVGISLNAHSAAITNGDFQSCDYTGWQIDTDGLGDISIGNDFLIDGTPDHCRAQINVDFYDSAGDAFGTPLSEAWFANTLYQELDLTGAVGSNWSLTIEYEVGLEASNQDPSFIADYFLVGLNDGFGNYYDETGALGFLVSPTDITSSNSYLLSFELDSAFTNTSGWYLDFQLILGVDNFGWTDAFGSTLFVNEVTLAENKLAITDASEPSIFAIFALGLVSLVNRKKLLLSEG